MWNNSGVINLPVEKLVLREKSPQQQYLTSGLSMKAGGLGFSPASEDITQEKSWQPAISRELVAYYSLEISPVFTNNMIYIDL